MISKDNACANLSINNLELLVHLGWSSEERSMKQVILLDVDVYFAKPPLACETDKLSDTVCYATLISKIQQNIADKHFHLIENLSAVLHKLIKTMLPNDARVLVRITKHPDISGLKGGVVFSYG